MSGHKRLRGAELPLTATPLGGNSRTHIFPVIRGKAVAYEFKVGINRRNILPISKEICPMVTSGFPDLVVGLIKLSPDDSQARPVLQLCTYNWLAPRLPWPMEYIRKDLHDTARTVFWLDATAPHSTIASVAFKILITRGEIQSVYIMANRYHLRQSLPMTHFFITHAVRSYKSLP